ncbi:MAG: sugar transferase [Candidatus Zhuqueibacterota bacterium]
MNGSVKNLYSVESFKKLLFIEKRRAERSNASSSLILLNFRRYAETIHKNGNLFLKDTEYLVKLICTNIRETDVVCLYDCLTVFILLPDTRVEGAKIACKRIVEQLIFAQNNYYYINELNYNTLDIEVISYPTHDRLKEGEAEYPGTRPSIHKQNVFSGRNGSVALFNVLLIHNSEKNLEFRQSSVNYESIALPVLNMFFWENHFISVFHSFTKKFAKRGMDFVGAIFLILLLLPAFLIIGFLVKVTSKGSIIYKQIRIGHKGRYFKFYKFRSMFQNCDHRVHQEYVKNLIRGNSEEINNGTKDDPFFKINNDPRITSLGRILRMTSLDELPQLFNVLKGEMSLVGPRPPLPYEIENYKPWHFRRILEVKPGITGLWQVNGRNKTTFDEMVRMDIHYAEKWSLFLDLKILLKTIKVLFVFDGK